MGSGSTLAASEAVGYESLGIERFEDYFNLAEEAIPQLYQAIDLKRQNSLAL